MKQEPKNERGGRRRGRKETLADQPLDFWKPVFASERSAWLARLVEQYWHVSIKGLFHTERSCMVRDASSCGNCCLFWLARFTLQCKSIFFNFFWNTKLFLRLYKGTGFRSFILQSSSWIWITKSDFLCWEMQWFPVMFCHAGPSSLVFFLWDVKFSWIVIYRLKNWSYIDYGELHCDWVKIAAWFSTRTSSVAALALFLGAFTRAL